MNKKTERRQRRAEEGRHQEGRQPDHLLLADLRQGGSQSRQDRQAQGRQEGPEEVARQPQGRRQRPRQPGQDHQDEGRRQSRQAGARPGVGPRQQDEQDRQGLRLLVLPRQRVGWAREESLEVARCGCGAAAALTIPAPASAAASTRSEFVGKAELLCKDANRAISRRSNHLYLKYQRLRPHRAVLQAEQARRSGATMHSSTAATRGC